MIMYLYRISVFLMSSLLHQKPLIRYINWVSECFSSIMFEVVCRKWKRHRWSISIFIYLEVVLWFATHKPVVQGILQRGYFRRVVYTHFNVWRGDSNEADVRRVHQLHIDPQNMSNVALKGVNTVHNHVRIPHIITSSGSRIHPIFNHWSICPCIHTYTIYIYIYICMVKNIAFWINTWYNL